jgi:hypothetical protein
MISDAWPRIALQTLVDHEIHMFFEFDGVPLTGPRTTLGDLVSDKSAWIPTDQVPALRGRYRDERIWQKGQGSAGSDFYEHLADMVDGRRDDLATFWTLSAHATDLVANADLYEEDTLRADRVRKQIVMSLGDRRSDRLRTHGVALRSLSIVLSSANLHVFTTGKSFAHVVVTIEPVGGDGSVTALELLEAQVSLARVNELTWQPVGAEETSKGSEFSLNLLVRQLVQGTKIVTSKAGHKTIRGPKPKSKNTLRPKAERTRTYTYARFDKPVSPADSDVFGFYLARHYTTDYIVASDMKGVECVREFETVRHTVALEGAATIISPVATDVVPKFIEKFRTNALHQHYVPIALLALHEYGFLVDRTSRSVINYKDVIEENNLGGTLAILDHLRSESLAFRVCYRFSQVSHITMHNEFNRAFRKAFELDRMMNDLAANVTEIEAYIRTVDERNSQDRFFWFSVVAAAALTFLTAYSIFSDLVKAHASSSPSDIESLVPALIVSMVAVGLLWYRRPTRRAEVKGDLAKESMLELMTTSTQSSS